MRSLVRMGLCALAATLALGACSSGGDDESGTGTEVAATSTAGSMAASPPAGAGVTASATAPAGGVDAEADSVEGVQALARTIDEALGRGDVDPVTSRVRGTPEVAFSQWGQPASTLPIERAQAELTQLLTRTRASDRDPYGPAAPKVWRVGYDMTRPHLVLTAISLDEATGYRRIGLLLQLRWCGEDCLPADQGRWVISGVVLEWGEGFLRATDEFYAAFGRPGEAYRRPLALTPEIAQAAADVAKAFGEGVRAIPHCDPTAACVTVADPGSAVDLGVMKLGYQPPDGRDGSALLLAGRTPSGQWGLWFGTQNAFYQMADLPGDVLVCSDGDGLNVRERPDGGAAVVGFLPDLGKVRAEEFVLTMPGVAPGGRGLGWYRVSGGGLPSGGWVASPFVTDARLGTCDLRNAMERG